MSVELDNLTILQCKIFQSLREERCLVDRNNLLDCSFFNGKVSFAHDLGLLAQGHVSELFIRTMD